MRRGTAFSRAARVTFKPDKSGMYSGQDTDGTEVLVYFNDRSNVISCTEIEADLGPDKYLDKVAFAGLLPSHPALTTGPLDMAV